MLSGHARRRIVRTVEAGGIIAYPTEAVFGLGCDPLDDAALLRLAELKERDPFAGFIVIAADLAQLEPLLASLDAATTRRVSAQWPGPVTWALPCVPGLSPLLTGDRDTLAVRVTAHPVARALCQACGPLVSTSANRSGRPPARSALMVQRAFGDAVDLIVPGRTGGLRRPTPIRDARSGDTLRE